MVARVTSQPRVRVFIGTSAAGEDAEACAVAEAGIINRASVDVDVTFLTLSRAANALGHGWQTSTWATPWTGLRWTVPELCKWEGRAVYLDCPTIVLGDVSQLLAAPFPPGTSVLMRREGRIFRSGCVVWDCEAAQRWLPPIAELRADPSAHQRMMTTLADRRSLSGPLPVGWGLHDVDYSRDPASVTGSVQCINPYMQPHVRHAHRRLRADGRNHWFAGTRVPHFSPGLVDLFDRELGTAAAAGYVPDDYIFEPDYGTYEIAGMDQGRKTA